MDTLTKTNSVAGFEQTIQVRSLEMLKTPRSLRPLAFIVALFVVGVIAALALIPWQQSVSGTGRVMVLSPMDRPQNIEAQIPGRLVKWIVREGQEVKADQTIAEIEDIDSKFLDKSQVDRLKAQRRTQEAKLAAANSRAAALESQIGNATRSRQIAIPTAQEKARQNVDKLRAAEQAVAANRQSLKTAELNIARIRELNEQGLRSRRDLEVAELDTVRARTELERAQASLEVARRDNSIGDFDQQKVEADTAASLSGLEASLSSVRETIATIESDILKLDVDLQNVSVRQGQQIVRAPRDGQIVRLLKIGAGATVKAGDVLAVIAPKTNDQAVEIMLSDNDAPLVSVGRQVRLQFAGFPALQFTGIPFLAAGTFAGRVAVIDAVDDGKNRYRVIVTPDREAINSGKEPAWIPNQYLRPGTETVGWVMLDTVPLGFELWRQFNAFPPTIRLEPIDKKGEQMLDEKIDLKDVLSK